MIIRIAVLWMILGFSLISLAQKTDSIFHVNGNIFLGEIKKLEYGLVEYKMDGMGTVKIRVDRISTIKSDKLFEFTSKKGETTYGFLDSTTYSGWVKIISESSSEIHDLNYIVQIYPIKNSAFLRLSGKFNLGFNYTKASNVGRFNFDWGLYYRQKKTYFGFEGGSIQTFEPNDSSSTTSKYDITLYMERTIKGPWSAIGYLSGTQNTELELDLRFNGAIGALVELVHSQTQRLFVVAAAAPNYELAQNKTSETYNFEGQLSGSYQIFKRTDPEISLTNTLDYYQSFSRNRYRVDYFLDVKFEIINNLFLGGNFYYNFDSNPVSETASNSDFGFTTTIGYSFH